MRRILLLLVFLSVAVGSRANIWRANVDSNNSGGGSIIIASNQVDSVALNHASNFIYSVTITPQVMQEFSHNSKGASIGDATNITIRTPGDYKMGFTISACLTNGTAVTNATISAGIYSNGTVQTSLDATRSFSSNSVFGALSADNIIYNVASGTVFSLQLFMPNTNGLATSVSFLTTNVDFYAMQIAGSAGPQGIQGTPGIGNGGITNLADDATLQFKSNLVTGVGSTVEVFNVSIPGIAAKGVLTNGENKIYWADAFLTNNGVFNDYADLTNLLTIAQTNSTIYFSGKSCFISYPTNLAHGFIYQPSNVRWVGNGQTMVMTDTFIAAGSIDLRNMNGFWVDNMNFVAPAVPSNNTTQAQSWFTYNGTNYNWHFSNIQSSGGHFFIVGGIDLPLANYNVTFTDCIFSNVGSNAGADGGPIIIVGRHVYISNMTASNVYRVIEIYNPSSGGMADSGDYVFKNITAKDVESAVIYNASGGSAADTVIIDNVTLENPSYTSNSIYNTPNIIYMPLALSQSIKNVFPLNPLPGEQFSGAVYNSLTGVTNLIMENVRGLSTDVGDMMTASRFSLNDCNFGTLTIVAGSTGSLKRVASLGVVNNGLLSAVEDLVGNVTVGGTLTTVGGATIGGNAIFNKGVAFPGLIWITNSGSINFNNASITNLSYIGDTSYGTTTMSNLFLTSGFRPLPGAEIMAVKTNSGGPAWTFDFGSGKINTANGGRYFTLTNQFDSADILCYPLLNVYVIRTGNLTNTVNSGGGGSSGTTTGLWTSLVRNYVNGTNRNAAINDGQPFLDTNSSSLVMLTNAVNGGTTSFGLQTELMTTNGLAFMRNDSGQAIPLMKINGALNVDGFSLGNAATTYGTNMFIRNHTGWIGQANGTNFTTVSGSYTVGQPGVSNLAFVTSGVAFSNEYDTVTISANGTLASAVGGNAYFAIIDITAKSTNALNLPSGVVMNFNPTLSLTVGPRDICIISNSAGTAASSSLNWVNQTVY